MIAMSISLIVAMDINRAIGVDGRLPWRLPADLRRFRSITMGKPIIMGRRTYESIGRSLDGRHNIVLTRNVAYQAQGCTIVHSIDQAIAEAGDEEIMVIGGTMLFEQFLPKADRLYLTLIEEEFEGDTYFPEIDFAKWVETSRKSFSPKKQRPFTFHFVVMDRL